MNRHHDESGVTLVEIVISIAIGAIILLALANVSTVALRTTDQTETSMESSTSAFRSSSRFADDVAAVGNVAGLVAPIGRGQTGCGNDPSVIRLIGAGATSNVTVRSYHRVVVKGILTLQRRQCGGPTLGAALAASTTSETVVADLGPAASSSSVTCNGDTILPIDDHNCTVATLTITTSGGLTFSLVGGLTAILNPTATTAVTPIRAPATGTCTLFASETGWGATGGVAGGTGGHYGDTTLYTYNDTNQRNSFLKFDLTTGRCEGAGDSWPTLPGGRLLTSVKLYLTYLGKTNDKCWIFPGISYDGQVLETLDTASQWTEASLTGSNMPGGTRNSYSFNVGNANSPTEHVNAAITDAVRQWYAVGGWKSNGFRLRRSSVGDTCGDSNKFASRFTPTVNQRPRLVITWG